MRLEVVPENGLLYLRLELGAENGLLCLRLELGAKKRPTAQYLRLEAARIGFDNRRASLGVGELLAQRRQLVLLQTQSEMQLECGTG